MRILLLCLIPLVAFADERPRLFGPPGVSAAALRKQVARRLASKDSGLAALAKAVRSQGGRKVRGGGEFKATDYSSASQAKAAALLAWVEDDGAARERALAMLRRCPQQPGRSWGSYIHVSEALIAWLQAYDLLLASGEVPAATTARLRGFAGLFYTRVAKQNIGFIQMRLNNHGSKSAAAIGLAALCFPGDETEAWLAFGEGLLGRVHARQLTPEGGWGEGPKYFEYSASCELPFLIARRRHGKDGFASERLREAYRWMLRIRMPDGMRPNIDDSNYRAFYGALVAGACEDPTLLWDWLEGEGGARCFSGSMPSLAVDMLCAWPDRMKPRPPASPGGQLLPGFGAVLRSGWGAKDSYVLMLAESGPAHKAGGGHEHPDPTSLIVAGKGERFIVDAGYVSWAKRRVVYAAEHHNLITVDGKGPPIREAFGGAVVASGEPTVGGWLEHGPLQTAVATARYLGATIRRRVVLIGGDALLVLDAATVDDGSRKRLEQRWNLHVGSTVGGTLREDGERRWTLLRPKAHLQLEIASDAAPKTATAPGDYGQRYGKVDRLTRLIVARQAAAARWTTLMQLRDGAPKGKPSAGLGERGWLAAGQTWQLERGPEGFTLRGRRKRDRTLLAAGAGARKLGTLRWTQGADQLLALTTTPTGASGRLIGGAPLTIELGGRAVVEGARQPSPTSLRLEPDQRFALRWIQR